jgi:riboflavin kinase / FMN adenylyltransferase
MSHVYNLDNIHLLRPAVVTIGVFDGVHRGHQHLIKRLVKEAHQNDMLAVVLTFFPHPDMVIRGLEGRYYLTTPEQRAQYFLDLGVDVVVTHAFDEHIRQIRAADFVDQLIHHLQVKELWVGADFALGYKREGDVAFLKAQGQEKGFSVEAVDLVSAEAIEETISSTLIRELVQAGEMEKARALLGRGYALAGEVVHGKKRGRQIGFPTANVDVWDEQIIPINGVYAGWAYLGDERFMAMTNVGVSPTFEYKGVTVEAYLLDFDRDIYGQTLTVTFEKFLRPEAKYDGLEALIAQINRDVDNGRQYLTALNAQSG